MPARLSLLLLLACLCLVGWWQWPRPSAPDQADPGHGPALESSADPTLQGTGVDPERDPRADPELSRQSIQGNGLLVHGRVIDADGRPVFGVAVRVLWRSGRRRTQTGAEGRFQLEIPTLRERFRLAASHPQGSPVEGYLPGAEDGQIDAGEVRLGQGPVIEAKVVDTEGRPVAGASCNLTYEAIAGERYRPQGLRAIRSDSGGRLHLPDRLAAGHWILTTDAPIRVLEPRRLVIPGDQESFALRITVAVPPAEDCIYGEVRHGVTSAPVSCGVHARDSKGEILAFAAARKTGQFVLVRPQKATRDPVRLEVSAHGFERYHHAEMVHWGTRDLQLDLQPSAGMPILVRQAGTDRPVENYRAFWYTPYKRGSGWPRGASPKGPHPQGRVILNRVPKGTGFVHVLPGDESLCPSEPVPYRQPGAGPLEIYLHTSVPLRLRLMTMDGRPLAGSTLRLVRQRGPKPPKAHSKTMSPRTWQVLSMAQHTNTHLLLDQARSDSEGRARLLWHRHEPGELFLLVEGSEHLPHIQPVSMQTEELLLRLPAGAMIRGRVLPAEARERMRRRSARLLVQATPRDLPMVRPRHTEVDAEGRYQLGGLHPGRWRLQLLAEQDARKRGGRFTWPRDLQLQLQAGSQLVQDLRLDGQSPGRLEGTLRIDGAPAAGAGLRLTPADGTTHSWQGSCDPDGRFVFEYVNPGEFFLEVQRRDSKRRSQVLLYPQALRIAPGIDRRQDIDLRTGSLNLRLSDASGKPVTLRPVRLRPRRAQRSLHTAADAQGLVRLDHLVVGEYDILLPKGGKAGGDLRIGSIRIDPGANPRQLRLPETR